MKTTDYFSLMRRVTDIKATPVKPLKGFDTDKELYQLYLSPVKSSVITTPLTNLNSQGAILVHNLSDYRKTIRSLQILPYTDNVLDIFIEGEEAKCSLIL